MQKITWEIQCLSQIPVLRYCKKCGKKTEYVSSGLFRVNAQRKYLDIWLVYRCAACDATWNLTIYSRISPKSLQPKLLEKFHANDDTLAQQYAMDAELLLRNGAEIGAVDYRIVGPEIGLDTLTELQIRSQYPLRIKVASILRSKLSLSQKAYETMLLGGRIKSMDGSDLNKCRLQKEMILILDRVSETV